LRLLFLGQINLRKGIGRLIDAMRLLKDDARIELTLAGPSEIDESCWADLPNVRWIGPVRRSEVMDVYRQSDVFILPTLSDGYALTQLEALSVGVPVIASKYCGEAVEHGHNGWLLNDVEPTTIASAIVVAFEGIADLSWSATDASFGVQELGSRLLALVD
jgi:glycosyltransferase involved in cell wall biosynthesis